VESAVSGKFPKISDIKDAVLEEFLRKARFENSKAP
jgi:hypothetical protein